CLGRTAGNALEVREAIDVLTGRETDSRLKTVTLALAAELIELGGLAPTIDEAKVTLERALADGRAAACFQRMIADLGGPSDLLEKPERYLPKSKVKRPVFLSHAGFVAAIDTRALGLAIVQLGGGRTRPEDEVDPSVGLSEVLSLGDEVDDKNPFAEVHAATEDDADRAIQQIKAAVVVADAPSPAASPLILESVV
ncbi:MAG: thymidine phosphorylase, partial [Geminicoccaceae bacterium]